MPSSIGSTPDEDIFVTIVRGLGRARMIREVIKVLDLVSKFERNPSLKLFNSILDVLVKEDIDLAREFYRKKMMGCGVRGDEYTFGILMKGLCLTNRIDEGFKLLAAMKNHGLTPNTVIYNTLLHGLLQALVMLERRVSVMGLLLDVVTVTKVIEILSNVGRVSEAVEVLERVESKGINVDVVAYNILIKGFCRTGKTKIAFRYLKEMENKGCLPNVDTYNALISGFCEAGMLDSALDVFHEMKTAGIRLELCHPLSFLLRWEKCFRELLIGAFEYSDSVKRAALKMQRGFYDQMTGEGGVPSAIVYAYLIHGLCQKGFAKEAVELTSEMFKLAYFPIASTFNALINEFCSQGKVGSAIKFLEDMIGRGCLPNIGSYSPLVEAFCTKGDFQNALSLFLQMLDKGHLVAVKLLVRAHHDVGFKEILNLIVSDIHPNIVRWYGVEYDQDFVYLSISGAMHLELKRSNSDVFRYL
ncbi:pentatricopeptide repeat (PPR) superfamily protein [Actinidia rufa]|uniref:Pentatricopeptide repeat (PPR) superfamily protein n=1 Tax=Actinidia rufa TaxID=165716 RepID=A0A7J0EP23_9ERIC|nr:pentatricopeptide repeat (PPR) superfamily protein [Actinidia rufa]